MGRRSSASQVGKGMRMLSVKQVVGSGEARKDCGPYRVSACCIMEGGP